MMNDTQEFDVAISFLANDEPLAIQIRDALSPQISVFVYSKKQEELAGRDGIEAFRDVFGSRARLNIVLYRGGWGKTRWTRVEETAIKEVCFEHGWERLFFVRLEQESEVPKWIPKPYLYLDFETFGLADLIGAIKARLIELEVEIAPISPADRAKKQALQRDFDKETDHLLNQGNSAFIGAFDEITEKLSILAEEISNETDWDVVAGEGALIGGFVVSAEGQTIQLSTQEVYANTAREAYVSVCEFNIGIPVNDPKRAYHSFEPIRPLKNRKLELRRLPDVGWCWEYGGKTLTPIAAAETIMHELLDRLK